VPWSVVTPKERSDAVMGRELDPKDVLSDLFDSADFPAEILDPEHAAEIVIQRLLDAGFKIEPARAMRPSVGETQPCHLTQLLRQ
jgi:hypothetical protein